MYRIPVLSIIFVFLLTLVHSQVFAVDRPVVDRMMVGSKAADRMEAKAANRSANLQERADKEITRRIESLTKLLTRISEFKNLSATQKTTLTTQVQAEIDSLTALQAKIAADTDQATLKTDVQSIVKSYRIYALFLPKIQILGAADRTLNVADEMSSHAATLETKISEKQSAGKDVSDLQTLLSDMQAKVADAKTQAQGAIDTVTPLTPDGFPDNKTQLQSARQMVVTAVKDLNTARQDARKIIVGLMKLGKMTSEASTTTPTVTETP